MKKVRDGAELLVLTDRTVYDADRRYLDPHLATSAVDQALKGFKVEPGEENLRRRCGIVLRSAAIRNVHDTMLALGLGANGVCPYTMVEVICVEDYETDVSNLCAALTKGIEKVISTIGIHEVRGYARQFSSIGVKPELAEIFHDRGLRRLRDRRGRLRRPRRGHQRARPHPRRRRGGQTGEDVPLLPQGLQGRDRHRQRLRLLRGLLGEGPRARAARARSRCATSWG